jgi:hypothetical protein
MNSGDIKNLTAETTPTVKPSTALNKQLQIEGLKQAADFQAKQILENKANAVSSISTISSQTTVGLKIYSGSMQQNVRINENKAADLADNSKDKDKPATLFDFDKVAENVMRFVGSVIKGAAANGADDERLASLFEQARTGVAKGIAMAENDIGSLMNDEISEGISRSRTLISDQIARLELDLSDSTEASEVNPLTTVGANVVEQNSGDLIIRTKDGDEVTLNFVDLRQVSLSRERIQSQTDDITTQTQTATDPINKSNQVTTFSAKTIEFSGFSMTISGELDEAELISVESLIGNASELADTFYRGDIESAFNQALAIGYDKQELVGFALQLNRVEKAEVVKAYDYVQRFNDEQSSERDQENSVKPVAQYLEKMLSVFEQSNQTLQSLGDYNTMINGIINEMKDIQVPDLVQAINRFHSFNQQMLETMPESVKKNNLENN